MQTIELADTLRQTTRLGYGCSSLMGAMGQKASVAILETAYDAGIRHFDVAPMYGFGEAEACLGEFLSRHKSDVTVATKYGIEPPKKQALLGMARRIAGPLVRMLPGLKARLSKTAASVAAPSARASFTAEAARASLERSLAALRTGHIDVWLLHEVETADLTDDGLLRFLEDSVAKGTIGTFGIGSEGHKVGPLLRERPAYCRVLQYEWSVLEPTIESGGSFRIHYRALTENFRSLHEALAADGAVCRRWSDAIGMDVGHREILAGLMLKAAFVTNRESVILVSSKDAGHIRENVRVAEDEAMAEPALRLHALVQAEGIPGKAVRA